MGEEERYYLLKSLSLYGGGGALLRFEVPASLWLGTGQVSKRAHVRVYPPPTPPPRSIREGERMQKKMKSDAQFLAD